MSSSDAPSDRGIRSDGPGIGALILFVVLAALLVAGFSVHHRRQAELLRERDLAEAERIRAEAVVAEGVGPGGDDPDARLREENERLREEVAALRRRSAEAGAGDGPVGDEAGAARPSP